MEPPVRGVPRPRVPRVSLDATTGRPPRRSLHLPRIAQKPPIRHCPMSPHRVPFVWLGFLLFATACHNGSTGAQTPRDSNPGNGPPAGTADVPDLASAAASGHPTGGGGGPVPEPTTLLLLGTGLVMITRFRCRRAPTT